MTKSNKEWPGHKWPGGTYKGKPVGKYGPLPGNHTLPPQADRGITKAPKKKYG